MMGSLHVDMLVADILVHIGGSGHCLCPQCQLDLQLEGDRPSCWDSWGTWARKLMDLLMVSTSYLR